MYTIHAGYNDFSGLFLKTELADSITSVLSAAAIYLEDPSCFMVKVWKTDDGKVIVDYWRE